MNPRLLMDKLCESLKSQPLLEIKVLEPIKLAADCSNSLREELITTANSSETPLHKAGVYLIGTENEVLRIGEGGPNSGNGGTMGHRIFQHFKKTEWIHEARVAILLSIEPREFSRLAEQLALALHFQSEGKLPRENPIWR